MGAESGRYQMRGDVWSLVRLQVQIIQCTSCLEEEGRVKALSWLDGKGRGEEEKGEAGVGEGVYGSWLLH